MAQTDSFNYAQSIKACLNGDESAFNDLYFHSVGMVTATCRKFMGNSGQAEEMVQETYLIMYQKLSQVKEPEKFMGWLNTVAQNCCKKELDNHKKKYPATPIAEVYDSAVSNDQVMYMSGSGNEINAMMDDLLVDRLMETLGDEERRLISLYYQGYKEKEIAEQLEIPLGTVKSRKHYALQKMEKTASAMEQRDEINLHGFTFPALFENMVLLRRIHQGLGWKPAPAAVSAGSGQTFTAEQKAPAAGSTVNAARAVPRSHMIFRWIALAISIGIVAAVIGTVVHHYSGGNAPRRSSSAVSSSARNNRTGQQRSGRNGQNSTTRNIQSVQPTGGNNAGAGANRARGNTPATQATSQPAPTTTRDDRIISYNVGGN